MGFRAFKNNQVKVLFVMGICMLLHFNGTGQEAREKAFGIEAPLTYNYLQDVKLHFLFSISMGQHMPFAGISFPVNDNPIANYGFTAGYRFFPNKQKQTFDFYFLYILQGDSRKLYSGSTVRGFSLHNQLGYGFNVYFNDKVYLVHHLAAGIENAWFFGYDGFTDLSISAAMGIGLKLGEMNKKDED